jgi:very-short-patch-repair endonuclease
MKKKISKIFEKSKTQSPIEEYLYRAFLDFGLKPECQYKVSPFFIDLAFPEIKLAIEADGKNWHWTKDQRDRDKYRQERLEKQGWRFERFIGWVCKKYPNVAVAKIATKYFKDKLTETQRKNAIGIIAGYIASNENDLDLTVRLIDEALADL